MANQCRVKVKSDKSVMDSIILLLLHSIDSPLVKALPVTFIEGL